MFFLGPFRSPRIACRMPDGKIIIIVIIVIIPEKSALRDEREMGWDGMHLATWWMSCKKITIGPVDLAALCDVFVFFVFRRSIGWVVLTIFYVPRRGG